MSYKENEWNFRINTQQQQCVHWKRRQRPARTKLIGAEKIKDIESPNAMFDTEEKGDKAERDEGS